MYTWYEIVASTLIFFPPFFSQQMLELGAIGVELECRQEQLQRELDALKADARAQEATWKGLERRNVRERERGREE